MGAANIVVKNVQNISVILTLQPFDFYQLHFVVISILRSNVILGSYISCATMFFVYVDIKSTKKCCEHFKFILYSIVIH